MEYRTLGRTGLRVSLLGMIMRRSGGGEIRSTCDGYWYDYFEVFAEYHPHRMEQKAPYREWSNDWPHTGYTFAMPVVYPWGRIFGWYDFENSDYRWFYNMLKVASNAGKHTPRDVPIIPFVHYHTVFYPLKPDAAVKQMSPESYQELLWHMLLRGCDTFFLWCQTKENPLEVKLVHEVWAASLQFSPWIVQGTPVTFDVPARPGPVVSALRMNNKLLVRRTDFTPHSPDPVPLRIGKKTLMIPPAPGQNQVLVVP